MTNREVISSFRTLTDKAQISDDSGWSTRMVFLHLLKYRSLLLSEKKRSNRKLNSDNYQTICIPLEEVDLVECPSLPPSGCKWLKTTRSVPKVIQGYQTIMSPSSSVRYEYMKWQDLEDLQYSKFEAVKERQYYTEKVTANGTFLYILNEDFLPSIQVTAMFYNPIEAQLFEGPDPDCKSHLDLEFMLDPDLLSPMLDLAMDRIYRFKERNTDLMNDDNDDIKNNPNRIK